jgi:hypothetical protein
MLAIHGIAFLSHYSELYAVRHELRFIDNNEKVSVADFFIPVLYAVL